MTITPLLPLNNRTCAQNSRGVGYIEGLMAGQQEPGMPDTAQECTLIYDADCRFCVAARNGIERAAEKEGLAQVRFLPYQSEEAARRLGEHYVPGRPEVAFLVGQDGTIQKGLDAFLPLLRGLRGGKLLYRLIRVPWFKPLAYLLYRFIARYRYQLFGSAR
jgi:predicted DCC family thiol-disulfide oxidoreductase YuxK